MATLAASQLGHRPIKIPQLQPVHAAVYSVWRESVGPGLDKSGRGV
jgi:hypothetical protein